MSIRAVVTRGYGAGGSIALVVKRGYAAEAVTAGPDFPNDARTLSSRFARARGIAASLNRVRLIGRRYPRMRSLRSE